MKRCPRAWWLPVGLTLAWFCVAGCAVTRKPLSPGNREAIYERTGLQFAEAILLKPLETKTTNSPGFQLAPLILQEVTDADRRAIMPRGLPTVFFSDGKVMQNGKPHKQVSFVWRHPILPARDASSRAAWQGVRITLNASGLPAIWEVLTDSTGAELVFVSRSLEAAARREFGPPLPGRRFAVERSVAGKPNVVVARVLDDAPVPMGPIVYLQAGTGDVGTIICRCMDAQARTLAGTAYFELAADQAALEITTPLELRARGKKWASSRFGEAFEDKRLQRNLRLPRDF